METKLSASLGDTDAKKFKCPNCNRTDLTIVGVKYNGIYMGVCSSCGFFKKLNRAEEVGELIRRTCDIKGCSNVIEEGKQLKFRAAFLNADNEQIVPDGKDQSPTVPTASMAFDGDICEECAEYMVDMINKFYTEGRKKTFPPRNKKGPADSVDKQGA